MTTPNMINRANFGLALEPELATSVLIDPLAQEAIAALVSTQHRTAKYEVHFPRVLEDPNTEWLEEGDEINPSAPQMGDVTVRPAKVAGLSIITSEALDDSSIDISTIVGSGLVRDIAKKVDAAFFGALTEPAPAGLETLTEVTTVAAGAAFTNLDPFESAVSAARSVNATITNFVANPNDALELATLKKATGSNESLLADSATAAAARQVAGVPLRTSPAVTPGTVWGIPADRVMMVVRKDAELKVSDGPFFTSDRVAVRAIMRVGFGFIDPAAIIKITTG